MATATSGHIYDIMPHGKHTEVWLPIKGIVLVFMSDYIIREQGV